MKKGNLIYGQSGGPSSVINASAYGVISEALEQENIEQVFVMKHGIEGVFKNEIYDVSEFLDELPYLKDTPASAFGSVRYKLPSIDVKEVYEEIFNRFTEYNIKYVVYNGGNDSMDTCLKLSQYAALNDIDIKIVGVPKTVDNDLPHTDHTPGFGSAAKYIANTVMQIKLDSTVYPEGKITIVEVMGRHAGWLTASSHVASLANLGPDLVYIPELPISIEQLIEDVKTVYQKSKNCLIVVSEGIKDTEGNFIGMMNQGVDAFGHHQLGGVAMVLGEILKKELQISYRAIELSSTQRSASFIRSRTDVIEAEGVGRAAVTLLQQGETGKMVTINRISNQPYQISYGSFDVSKIANLEQTIPKSMIDYTGVKPSFYDYILPLIQGEASCEYQNGIQKLFRLKK